MERYDLCVRCADIGAAAESAKSLGWDGICALLPKPSNAKPQAGIGMGIEVRAKRPDDVHSCIEAYRRRADILAFRAADLETARAVLESPEADMLVGAWENGMNHVLAGLARDNNVAICFEFQPLLFSRGRERAGIFQRMLDAARFVAKSKAPFVISSGAQDAMDLRDPWEIASFGSVLGFREADIRKSMRPSTIEENRKRLSGKWVMPGVEYV